MRIIVPGIELETPTISVWFTRPSPQYRRDHQNICLDKILQNPNNIRNTIHFIVHQYRI